MSIVGNYEAAKEAVKQIKNGEWYAHVNKINWKVYTLKSKSKNIEIWVSNGGFCCGIYNPYSDVIEVINAFGIIFRHWVYFHAKKIVKDELKKEKLKRDNYKKEVKNKIFN